MRSIALRPGRAWFSIAAFSLVAAFAASSLADAPPAPVSSIASDAGAIIVESVGQNVAETEAALERRINAYAAAMPEALR